MERQRQRLMERFPLEREQPARALGRDADGAVSDAGG
jgi:hypothetical protein